MTDFFIKIQYYIFIRVLLFACPMLLSAQVGVQFWDTESGLPNNWVSDILQDDEGYIWLATQYGLSRFDGYQFKTYQYQPNQAGSLSGNWVRTIAQDSSGIIWLGISPVGVDAFDPQTGQAKNHPLYLPEKQRNTNGIRKIIVDHSQNIWAGTSEGLFVKTPAQDSFQFQQKVFAYKVVMDQLGQIYVLSNDAIYRYTSVNIAPELLLAFPNRSIRDIFIDQSNQIWAYGKDNFLTLQQTNAGWQQQVFALDNVAASQYFYDSPIYEDDFQQLYLGGQKGISIINKDRQSVRISQYDQLFPKGKNIGNALCFLKDKHGNFWTGTTKGLLLQSPLGQRLTPPERFPDLSTFPLVRSVLQTGQQLWVGNNQGLHLFDLNTPNAPPKLVMHHPVYTLLSAKNGSIYVGSWGLYQVNPASLQAKKIALKAQDRSIIWALAEDKYQQLWIGSVNSFYRYQASTNIVEELSKDNIPNLNALPTQAFWVDRSANFWAGSLHHGLFRLPPDQQLLPPQEMTFQQLNHVKEQVNSISNPMVLAMTEDLNGNIWVGTDGGLNQIDPNTFSVRRYLHTNGLVDDKIMGLTTDNQGYIWGSTIGHGLFRVDTKTASIKIFNQKDGLVSNNFLLNAAYKNAAGILFFGADNGLQIIDPLQMDRVKKPSVDFDFSELQLTRSASDSLSNIISLQQKTQVEIPYNYQSFSIQYTTLNFYQADKTRYEYRLDGLHDHWQSNGQNRRITFNGLSAGTYQLHIKAINTDLDFIHPEQQLQIIILPPWWATKWAYMVYGMLFLFLLYTLYRFQLNRQLEKAEAQRLIEMDALKTNLYTNITHEFRTPLTVILGMTKQISSTATTEIAAKANLIQRNGQRLLDLINQILDLSKVEAGKLQLNYINNDFLRYLHYLAESFHSLAAEKNIRLHVLSDLDTLFMDFDVEKTRQVFTNLMANAIQYTNAGGDIYLQVTKKENTIIISIRDTGQGIAAEHLPYIFDRFYQTANPTGGTGIGLALTKELVELMDGTIQVKSQLKKGTTFILHLPIRQQAQTETIDFNATSSNKVASAITHFTDLEETEDGNDPVILLVEDNTDVVQYLVSCLSDHYRLVIANDGAMGIEQGIAIIPDLIISDVMMPHKNGYELCAMLKKDERTNHIPIILLTAKADLDSKIRGLEKGADAYLPKPFEPQELQVRIRKLLELREQLQKRYRAAILHPKPLNEPPVIEDEFVIKIKTILKEHIADSTFGIPQLCQKAGISRVHLHRKLKALTDLSTSHFIRQIRLQQARHLLQTTDLNVSEVAYDVGFSDPAYFSRLYSEAFGESPSATAQRK